MKRKEIGVSIDCTVCGLQKRPRGRDAPAAMGSSLCDWECPGYMQEPFPGTLWPGETGGEVRG